MPAKRRKPRRHRARNTLILLALVAVGVSFYYGGVLDIMASQLRVGYGTSDRINWNDKPFSIGHPDKYRAEGVNFDFVKSHGVYIATTRKMIVAISVESPATGKPTRYEPMIDQFSDPYNGDRFYTNGTIRGVTRDERRTLDDREAVKKLLDSGKPFSRSLERCYIKLEGRPEDPDAELIVDPRHRYLFELNEWSHPYNAWEFPD